MTDILLDLDTLIVRPVVQIDGTRYEILSPDELSVLDNRRFALWSKQLHDLQQVEAEQPELGALVDRIARKVLVGVPDDLVDRLSGSQKIAVVEVFTGLLLRTKLRVAGATGIAMGLAGGALAGGALAGGQTGARLSPGSSDFMAAARASGWKRRLSAWFRPMSR